QPEQQATAPTDGLHGVWRQGLLPHLGIGLGDRLLVGATGPLVRPPVGPLPCLGRPFGNGTAAILLFLRNMDNRRGYIPPLVSSVTHLFYTCTGRFLALFISNNNTCQRARYTFYNAYSTRKFLGLT